MTCTLYTSTCKYCLAGKTNQHLGKYNYTETPVTQFNFTVSKF